MPNVLQRTEEWVPFIFPETRKRFWAKVDIRDVTECWPWTAYIDPNGYGNMRIERKTIRSHVMAYVIHTGDTDLNGYCIRHSTSCKFKDCSNPFHMAKGTASDNQIDKAIVGNDPRQKLTVDDVLEVDKLIEDGWSNPEIAARYDVTRHAIYRIRTGDNWSWLTGR